MTFGHAKITSQTDSVIDKIAHNFRKEISIHEEIPECPEQHDIIDQVIEERSKSTTPKQINLNKEYKPKLNKFVKDYVSPYR
jgi:hypothetical protein